MIPTYKEYENDIKEQVYTYLKQSEGEEETQAYLNSDTVNELIKDRYSRAVRDYKSGKLLDVAWGGNEASAAYCLYLMF